jgi:predicted ArsR family transcriptional regulator
VKFTEPATSLSSASPSSASGSPGAGAADVPAAPGEHRTRNLVLRSILQHGPLTAAALADRLQLSAAGVRRHLDALVAEGVLVEVEPRGTLRHRGRGRPARAYALTDAGRSGFEHAYDDLASTALRYLRETGGEGAVQAFAEHRAQTLVGRIHAKVDAAGTSLAELDTPDRAGVLISVLTEEGFAADVEPAAKGLQICQHHCPVAHVAAEFPELCEAETRALAEVLGTYVQRLATIAHGDGVCTTHVPLNQQRTPPHAEALTAPEPLRAEAEIAPIGRQM